MYSYAKSRTICATTKDPTSPLERKVQCTLRKIKQKLPTDVYALPNRIISRKVLWYSQGA